MSTLDELQNFAGNHPWAFAASVALVVGVTAYIQSPHYKLRHIPTVGSSSWPLLSYLGANRWNTKAQDYLQQGYERYHGRMFKVATMGRYIVVASGRTLIREIVALPDDTLSFLDGVDELTQTKYLVDQDLKENTFHIEIVKRDLTRNLAALLPEIYDEIDLAFNEYIPKTEEWASIPALNVIMMVVARASNRVIVGLPYCRDMEYLERCITYTRDWSESTQAISRYPGFMKPFVAPFINKLPATNKRVGEIIAPEIERRRKLMNEYGKDYPDKNNDFLSWMMDYTYGDPHSSSNSSIADRLVQINFAAIHTSSSTFTQVLYTLAAKPEWIQPLREEIEAVNETEGMTKAAMQKMVKLDALFRESHRVTALAGLTMTRMVLKSHTFSDGTFVPAGSIISVPTMPHQLDAANFENPNELDPSRFEHVKDSDATRRYFTSIDTEYMAFGLGKHACPGRFFAGNELKAMMVHLLLNYDVKFESEGIRPTNLVIGPSIMPNMEAKVMFRKRQT